MKKHRFSMNLILILCLLAMSSSFLVCGTLAKYVTTKQVATVSLTIGTPTQETSSQNVAVISDSPTTTYSMNSSENVLSSYAKEEVVTDNITDTDIISDGDTDIIIDSK